MWIDAQPWLNAPVPKSITTHRPQPFSNWFLRNHTFIRSDHNISNLNRNIISIFCLWQDFLCGCLAMFLKKIFLYYFPLCFFNIEILYCWSKTSHWCIWWDICKIVQTWSTKYFCPTSYFCRTTFSFKQSTIRN